MTDLTASIPHQLSRSEAKRRIQDQFGMVKQQYGGMLTGLQESWTGDTMAFSGNAMGQLVSGGLTVDDQAVHLTVTLPWLLRTLAETIEPKIEQQGRLLLGNQGVPVGKGGA
jgi:hypothetical protein